MPQIYLDTNVFVRGFETEPHISNPLDELFAFLRRRPGTAITSELTLAELTAPVDRSQSFSFVHRKAIYYDLLLWGGFVDLHPVSRAVLLDTAGFRALAREMGFKPKLPDSIHMVTAVRAGCAFLMTHDRKMGPMLTGMAAVSADSAGVAEVIRALDV